MRTTNFSGSLLYFRHLEFKNKPFFDIRFVISDPQKPIMLEVLHQNTACKCLWAVFTAFWTIVTVCRQLLVFKRFCLVDARVKSTETISVIWHELYIKARFRRGEFHFYLPHCCNWTKNGVIQPLLILFM